MHGIGNIMTINEVHPTTPEEIVLYAIYKTVERQVALLEKQNELLEKIEKVLVEEKTEGKRKK